MTQEEKEILLADLTARLPYGVKIGRQNCFDPNKIEIEVLSDILTSYEDLNIIIDNLHMKPYLRPMSSMTEEEMNFVNNEFFKNSDNFQIDDLGEMYTESQPFESIYTLSLKIQSKYFDWLNKNMFDYRWLIPMGLALEAPKGMYN